MKRLLGFIAYADYKSLLYFLIKEGFLNWQELCQFTSKNPSEFLGLNSGVIEVGKEANLVLFDENEEIFAPKSSLYSEDKLLERLRCI